MKKAVIFDLDGTLMNTIDDIADSVNQCLIREGLKPHPIEAYKLFTGDGAVNLIKRSLGSENMEHFESVYRAYREYYAKNCNNKTAPYDGVIEALNKLGEAGVKMMVLSNKDNQDVKSVINRYLSDVDFLRTQGRIDGYEVKPDPSLGLFMLKEEGLLNFELWYVGDTITDMKCAKNLKARSIGVCWGFQTKEMIASENPEFFAGRPGELVNIILNN